MTNYDPKVYEVLELADRRAWREDVRPEDEPALRVCLNKKLVGLEKVYDPVVPVRTRQVKAHELQPDDVIQIEPNDRSGFHVTTVKPVRHLGIVEVSGVAQSCKWPYNASVTVFDGSPPGPPKFRYRLTLSSDGKTTLTLHQMQSKRPRTGRPQKDETPKDQVVIAALAKHHQYEPGGSIGNHEPAGVRGLAKSVEGLTTAAITRFLQNKFGKDHAHKLYKAACFNNRIGRLLAEWQDDKGTGFISLSADEGDPDEQPSGRRWGKPRSYNDN